MRGIYRIGAAALVGVVSLLGVSTAQALLQDDESTSYTQPANTLVMPYDSREGKVSYLLVSNVNGSDAVNTHWTYWDEDGGLLTEAWACLNLNQTAVADPTYLMGVVGDGPSNLSGSRGMVIVTAYGADEDCVETGDRVDGAIVGTYTFADVPEQYAYGNDAIGLGLEPGGYPILPYANVQNLDVQTFSPTSLDNSTAVFLSLSEMAGPDGEEIGPNVDAISSSLTYYDEMADAHALPDAWVQAATLVSLQPGGGILPSASGIDTAGFIRMKYTAGVIGSDSMNFIYGIHGQAVGLFGGSTNIAYTVAYSDMGAN